MLSIWSRLKVCSLVKTLNKFKLLTQDNITLLTYSQNTNVLITCIKIIVNLLPA